MIKKTLILPLIAGTMILTGCNKADRDLTSPSGPATGTASLELKLKNYNQSLSDNETSPSRAIDWEKVKTVLKVVAADALGGLVSHNIAFGWTGNSQVAGAAAGVGGGLASIWASGSYAGGPGNGYDPNFNVDYAVPAGFSQVDIGSVHNDVLEQVHVGTQSLENYVNNNYGQLLSDTVVRIKFDNTVTACGTFGHNYYLSNYDYSVMYNEILTNQLASAGLVNIMSLLNDALMLTSNEAEIETTLAFYSNSIVGSTQLTSTEKASLIAGLSTTRSSINFWYHLGN